VLGLVQQFDAVAKPVAFVCHTGWVPISAKILEGRRGTTVAAFRNDVMNAGADRQLAAAADRGPPMVGADANCSQPPALWRQGCVKRDHSVASAPVQ
jgi:putative intracellular protease/amidase